MRRKPPKLGQLGCRTSVRDVRLALWPVQDFRQKAGPKFALRRSANTKGAAAVLRGASKGQPLCTTASATPQHESMATRFSKTCLPCQHSSLGMRPLGAAPALQSFLTPCKLQTVTDYAWSCSPLCVGDRTAYRGTAADDVAMEQQEGTLNPKTLSATERIAEGISPAGLPISFLCLSPKKVATASRRHGGVRTGTLTLRFSGWARTARPKHPSLTEAARMQPLLAQLVHGAPLCTVIALRTTTACHICVLSLVGHIS